MYSRAWDVTGFVGSLAVPRDADGVQARLQAMDGFFVANPSYEVPQLQLTSARCRELYNALVAAQTTLLLNVTETDSLLRIRNEKSAIVRKRIRGVINELSQLISPTDARWLAFGLNMPGAEATPDAPKDVTATIINPTTAEVRWPKAPRAKYYRVRKKVVGVDTEMVPIDSPTDPNFMLEGLPPNSTIEVAVSAVNDGGESPLSAVIVIRT